MAIRVFEDSSTKKYRVVVKSPVTSGYSCSPEYFSEGQCYTWIANQLFDDSVKVEIEEIRKYKISSFNYFSDYEKNVPSEVTQTGFFSSIDKKLYHDGCVDKVYVDKTVAEIQDRLNN